MITRRIFALIRSLMFLVNDDQPQPLKRGKKRRSRSDHDIDVSRLCPLELIIPLPRRKSGIHDRNPASEPAAEPHDGLIRQCDLRNQHDHLPPLCEHMRDQFHIHFRLAASCHTLEQIRLPSSFVPVMRHRIHHPLLLLVQLQPVFLLCQMLHRIPVTRRRLDHNNSLLGHASNG